MNIGKKIFGFIVIICCSICLNAKDLVVKSNAMVGVNAQFQIEYSIEYDSDNPVVKFHRPEFIDFKVIAGPTEFTRSSMVNGVTTASISFIYYVQALKEGMFDVPQAGVELKNGTVVKSKPKSIEVVKETNNNAATQPNTQTGEISDDDLFLNMEFNRQSVYKGEPVIMTLKLYSRVAVANVSNFKMPTLAGFDTQELKVSDNESGQQKYNNKIYNTHTLLRMILYPLRAGDLKLEPVELVATVQVRQQTRSSDMFDLFMGPMLRNVSKQLKTAPVSLKIKDFPAGAPVSFSGATGSFGINSKIDKTESIANQPITYSITVSGTGNYKQINELQISFPENFDKYDPKIIDNVKTGVSGGTGSKTFEYVVIPRNAGDFDIPPVEFSYFDTQKGSYTTLKTTPVHLKIEKDPNSANLQSIGTTPLVTGKKVKHLGNDILFIKTDMPVFNPVGYMFFGSLNFWLLLAAFVLIFVIVCVITKKMTKNRQNVALMRNKKANKVAISRLKQAAKLLKTGDSTGFYEEVSRAVWGYISDKLNMQSSELSRDNIQEKLSAQNVPQENTDLLISVIDNCEYARYAPDSNRKGMEEMYNEAVNAISKLENLK